MNVSEKTAKRFLLGDPNATNEVYGAYKNLLFFVISTYLSQKEDVEDAYQETFLRILASRDRVVSPKALHGYLLTTAKHVALDMAKAQKGIEPFDEDAAEDVPQGKLDDLLPYDLPFLDRQIIGYRLVFGLPWDEVVDLTGCPMSSAKLRYRQALEKIKGEYRK